METKNPKHRLVDENHTKLRVFKLLTTKPPKNKRHTPCGGRRTCYLVLPDSGLNKIGHNTNPKVNRYTVFSMGLNMHCFRHRMLESVFGPLQ